MVEKPAELVNLSEVLTRTFTVLKSRYGVKNYFALDLNSVDAVTEAQFQQHLEIAAISMRKIQLLHVLGKPGVRTRPVIVVCLCTELVSAISALLDTTAEIERDELQVLEHALESLQSLALVVTGMASPEEDQIFD